MPDSSTLALFCVATLVLLIVPGPAVITRHPERRPGAHGGHRVGLGHPRRLYGYRMEEVEVGETALREWTRRA